MSEEFPYPPELLEEMRDLFRLDAPPPEPALKRDLDRALRRIDYLERQVHILGELAETEVTSFRLLLDDLGIDWK